jgi:hypothetical protein
MKHYDTIPKYGEHIGLPIIAFDKLDGSNIRAEWTKKQGFYKFGTKNCMIDKDTPIFGKACTLIKEKYENELSKVFTNKDNRDILNFVCFFEFLGLKSEFGQHLEDDEHTVTLFDVNRYKKGLVTPKQFLKEYGHLDIPRVIYEGNLNHKLREDIWNNNDLVEGVVCKGLVKTKKNELVYMCKLKTKQWIDRLRNRVGEDSVVFNDEKQYIL